MDYWQVYIFRYDAYTETSVLQHQVHLDANVLHAQQLELVGNEHSGRP